MSDHKIKYQGFLNTILKLKDLYGSILFSEDRFWGLLTDFYNFSGESVLKEIAKECVSKGYVKDIASTSDFKRTIRHILNTYDSASLEKREAAATVSFAVAIALDKSSLEDYASYLNAIKRRGGDNTSKTAADVSSHATSNPTTKRIPKQRKTSDKLPFKLILLLVSGIAILIGSIYFYSAYLYHDFSIGAIILCETIVQILYISLARRAVENNKSLSNQKKLKFVTILLPIVFCYLLPDLAPILFLLKALKDSLYIAFSTDIGLYNILSDTIPGNSMIDFPKTPGIFTFLGTVLSLIFVFACVKGIHNLKKNCRGSSSTSYPALSWLSVGVIVLTLGSCLGIHLYKCEQKKKEYLAENRLFQEKIKQRAEEPRSLSFKGIELRATIDAITDLNNRDDDGETTDIKFSYAGRTQINLKSTKDIVADILNNRSPSLRELTDLQENGDNPKGIKEYVDEYTARSDFFSNTIKIQLLSFNGVRCIIVTPDDISSDDPYPQFNNFNDIYNLYVENYGKPVWGMRSEEYHSYNRDDTRGRYYYSWKFKNSEIQLSRYYIIYVDSAYVEELSSLIEEYNRDMSTDTDSTSLTKQREDSIKQAQLPVSARQNANKTPSTKYDSSKRDRPDISFFIILHNPGIPSR